MRARSYLQGVLGVMRKGAISVEGPLNKQPERGCCHHLQKEKVDVNRLMSWSFAVPLILLLVLVACGRMPIPQEAEAPEGEIRSAAVPTVCIGTSCYSSLQAAINAASAGDTITLGVGELTEAGIQVTKNLTIRGSASGHTIVQAAATPGTASDRVFTVNAGVTATLQNLTIRHGVAPDRSLGHGSDGGHGGHGGGIYNNGTLTVDRSTIRDNTAGNGGSCTRATNCHGYFGGDGGGIYNNGTLTVDRSTIRDNTTGNGGSCPGDDCSAGPGGHGGGIFNNNNGTLTVERSTIRDNTTGNGGSCTGDGCWPGLGGDGGGIMNNKTMTLTNSTLSGNRTGGGGGCSGTRCRRAFSGAGGGLHGHMQFAHLNNVTITNNQGRFAGGISHGGDFSNSIVTLKNSIVAGNVNDLNNASDCFSQSGIGIVSEGYNLVGTGTGCPTGGTGDQTVAPGSVFTTVLDSLQDNGGPTFTHALLSGSPAIDKIPPAACTDHNGDAVEQDQRGGARPQGEDCDVGAFEFGAEPPPADTTPPTITPSISGTLGNNGWYTSNVTVSWTVEDEESEITSQTGCGTTTISADTAGTTLTCEATSAGGTSSESVTIKRDATPPTLSPSVSPNPVLLGGSATALAGEADNLSGIASASCNPVNTSSVGAKTLSCSASDNAGNSATASASYSVVYGFTGFSAPVNSDALNVAKAGQTIPLKWRLTDASGNPVSNLASATVTVQSLSCSSGTTTDQVEEYASGGSGLQNLGDGYYQYNWKTPKDYANSCKTMHLDLGEGLTHTALFKFTK